MPRLLPLALPVPRRTALGWAALAALSAAGHARAQAKTPQQQQWIDAAVAMRELALSWGDQPYGAVLVSGGKIVAHGPSRVVKNRNPDAHAEREAIREGLETLGPDAVRGSTLVSTSRPCWPCEQAAAKAGVARMLFGATLEDAGAPRLGR